MISQQCLVYNVSNQCWQLLPSKENRYFTFSKYNMKQTEPNPITWIVNLDFGT
jgi:hypothetical protein